MAEAITWTFLYYSSFMEDVEKMLDFLRDYNSKNGLAIKSDLQRVVRDKNKRGFILEFMRDIYVIEEMQQARTSRYQITDEGIRYLEAGNKYKYLHKLLYKHILHYSYFYNYILENNLYEFSELQIIETMVLNSSYEFGVRIFDWKSAENVVNLMLHLGVLSQKDDMYYVKKEYRSQFNHQKFEELTLNKLNSDSPMFTKDLCAYLLDHESDFINLEEEPTIRMIYKHLLQLNESKGVLKFIPGLPRPPIPSKHTLVELRRG